MQATSNDFLVIQAADEDRLDALRRYAPQLCDRRKGLGADGIIVIQPHEEADMRMRVINADGSEAEMCGNGLRCAVLYMRQDTGELQRERWSVQTGAGLLHAWVRDEHTVRVHMGAPRLSPPDIPVQLDGPRVVDEAVSVDSQQVRITAVSMGNPHAVLFYPRLSDDLVHTIGPALESHSLFPRKTNVEFVTVHSAQEATMRVYERGVGETMACGTGACASVVAGILNGLLDTAVTVHLRGGDLHIEWDGSTDGPVYMTGTAFRVYEAEADAAHIAGTYTAAPTAAGEVT
jgi:diaminopimelate epimerase